MEHPYQEFLHLLEKPSRYVGGEYQSIEKPKAKVRFALAFPDVYEIGMSHMGFKILYDLLNKDPDIAAERVFAPWTDLEQELRCRKIPLISLESKQPLSTFDLVGFSLQYEMNYTNVLNMLDLGGIPIRSEDRANTDPLIVAGGPCATSPEPMTPFVDLFLIGDGEGLAEQLARAWVSFRKQGLTRKQTLAQFSSWKGLYVPSCYQTEIDPLSSMEVVTGPKTEIANYPIERHLIADINEYPYPDQSPVAFTETVFDRLSIELARGCTEGCRFCQAGMIYRPVRERDPDQVIKTILSGLKKGGYEQASITSLSTADYSCVSPLVKKLLGELRKTNSTLGISSLRAYGLSEDTLDEMTIDGATGLTFAPEAGTQKMRNVIAKNISEEDMMTTARRVFERGWKRMKLYFMIGLPTETEEDVAGIAETAKKVRNVSREVGNGRADVTVAVSSHVPKPHTPFQWAGMNSLDEISKKQNILRMLARRYRLTLRHHKARVSHVEGIISRGDRRVGDVIERAFRKGCRFDGWDEKFNFQHWNDSFQECGIDPEIYLQTVRVDARLPWDHIDVGVTREFLLREYRRALKGRLSPPCGKPFGDKVHHSNLREHESDERKLICYDCGIACDLGDMKEERATFLSSLKAFEPKATDLNESKKSLRIRSKEPDRGEFVGLRLQFTKLSPSNYVSHLDLARMVIRHFRRAGLALSFSGGYHPRPEVQFGPALPLGTLSIFEVVDVYLKKAPEISKILNQLNTVSEAGITYLKAELLERDVEPISQIVGSSQYLVSTVSASEKEILVRAWKERDLPKVVRERKGKKRVYELNEYVLDVLIDEDEIEIPNLLKDCFGKGVIQITMRSGQEGTLRPSELLNSLFPTNAGDQRCYARVSFKTASGQAIEIGAVPSKAEILPKRYSSYGEVASEFR